MNRRTVGMVFAACAAVIEGAPPSMHFGPESPPARKVTSIESSLEALDLGTGIRRVVYRTPGRIEAPNWSRDGKWLYYNGGGLIYRISPQGGLPQRIDTGPAVRCNNDHGLSPDGKQLAVSSHHGEGGVSRIYLLPAGGGAPRVVTERGPSYWHGWSPDGRTLAYCAERDGQFDIYAIPAAGGKEVRLTDAPGLDDGPDFTADGRHIYFNSNRTGVMQVWRMRPDGAAQERVTTDRFNNWFPHPSPDGKWLVYLSYEPGVEGHPADKAVALRVMPLAGGEFRTVARLLGGQGTINVPSWAPDSRQFAFVSYRLVDQ